MAKNQKETLEDLAQSIKKIEEEAAKIKASVSAVIKYDDNEELDAWYRETRSQENGIREQQRQDVIWLKHHLRKNSFELLLKRGCYVAILKQRIRAWGESKQIVRGELDLELGEVLAACAVILPVCVPGEETNLEWLEIQNKLGFDIHPE